MFMAALFITGGNINIHQGANGYTIVVRPYNRILSSNKKKGITHMQIMGESQNNGGERIKRAYVV